MPSVQEAVALGVTGDAQAVAAGITYGQKLDSAALAFGAALAAQAATQPAAANAVAAPEEGEAALVPPLALEEKGDKAASAVIDIPPASVNDDADGVEVLPAGIGAKAVAMAVAEEAAMATADAAVAAIADAKNSLESFILSRRSAPDNKHGEYIDRVALSQVLDEAENWLYYSDEVIQSLVENIGNQPRAEPRLFSSFGCQPANAC